MSSSVYATSTPSAVKRRSVVASADRPGVEPTIKWPWKPTPSMGAPAAWMIWMSSKARLVLAPLYSRL